MNASPKINMYPTREDLSAAAAGHITLLAAQATEKRHSFTVALSGGSLVEILAPHLAARPLCAEVDWSAWHVFWADERCVALSRPESNYGAAKRLLFNHVDIPSHQIHPLDDTLGAVAAAEAYESKEEVRKYLSPEEWWLEHFGDDPLWGNGKKR